MVGSFPACCARAASGHETEDAAAAPPSIVMNSRRLTESPHRSEAAATLDRRTQTQARLFRNVWAPQADVRNGFGDATRYALKRSRDTPLTAAVTEIPIRRVALAPGSGHLPRCPLPNGATVCSGSTKDRRKPRNTFAAVSAKSGQHRRSRPTAVGLHSEPSTKHAVAFPAGIKGLRENHRRAACGVRSTATAATHAGQVL